MKTFMSLTRFEAFSDGVFAIAMTGSDRGRTNRWSRPLKGQLLRV